MGKLKKFFSGLLLSATIPLTYIHADTVGTMLPGQVGYTSASAMVVDSHRHAWIYASAPIQDNLAAFDSLTNLWVERTPRGITAVLECGSTYKWTLHKKIMGKVIPVIKFSQQHVSNIDAPCQHW